MVGRAATAVRTCALLGALGCAAAFSAHPDSDEQEGQFPPELVCRPSDERIISTWGASSTSQARLGYVRQAAGVWKALGSFRRWGARVRCA